MTVRRFRHPDEAARALWTNAEDPDLPQRISSLWRTASRLATPLRFERGVRRFRSVEEADQDRNRLTAERIKQLRRRSVDRTRPHDPVATD